MSSIKTITVFTPCYNRGSLLPRLYASLLQQSTANFEWLLVDDGSTDDTKAVVASFIAEQKIPISYYYKSNGGKHTAINLGVQKAQGDLFFIVDSDDFLSNDALAVTTHFWEQYKDNSAVCGMIGLSEYTNGQTVGDLFLQDEWQLSFSDFYLKYQLRGDKSVAFKTSVMKAYPFPEAPGIRFVFEDVVWHAMSKSYDVLAVNKVIQYKEYLEEGLSDSSYKLWYIQSLAFSYFQLLANQTYSLSRYPKTYLWSFIHLASNSLLSGTSYFNQLPTLQSKCFYLLLFPRGYFSYWRMKKLIRT
ncbi:glycosyltransferase family 2 protein [Flavobacterium sp.]|uniref:glycosyltransferase family A protein n=1 Tax=Flavobacterium sp. TaxID=239 RepID=UPI002615FC42|nr:glycosyltransferase family 2 protein [Flavobacterium sp.]